MQSELEKQLGQPVNISPAAGLDPSKYQNFAITNDAIIFFFSQGDLLPEAAGAVAGVGPAWAHRLDDQLSAQDGANPYT